MMMMMSLSRVKVRKNREVCFLKVAHAAGPPLHAEPKKQKKRRETLFL